MPDENDRSTRLTPNSPSDGVPHFGRLLMVLVIVVLLIGLLTFGSEAYFS